MALVDGQCIRGGRGGGLVGVLGHRLDVFGGQRLTSAQTLGASAVSAPALAGEPLVGEAAVDAFALDDIGGNAGFALSRDRVLDLARDRRAFLNERVGYAGRVVFALAVGVVGARGLRLAVALGVFARRGDGPAGLLLRGEGDEDDVGDLVDGLAADLGDLFAAGDGDEEDGGCDFEEAYGWWTISSCCAQLGGLGTGARPRMPCASSDTRDVSSSRPSLSSGPTLPR
jgi:hypothetical protein